MYDRLLCACGALDKVVGRLLNCTLGDEKVSTSEQLTHWRDAEATIRSILGLLSLSPEQFKEAGDFLDHNELGLALETLCDIHIDEDLPLSVEAYEMIRNVGERMEMSGASRAWADRLLTLANHVKRG